MSGEERIVVEAPTIEEAVRRAAERLACPVQHVRHRVVAEPSRGLFGLGRTHAVINAWKHDPLASHVDQALGAVKDMDGHFQIELDGATLRLALFPPRGAGQPVTRGRLEAALAEYEPESLDHAAIERVLAEADGAPRVVGRLRAAGERDGRFLLKIAPDAMLVEIVLIPPKKGGRDATAAEILKELADSGVIRGLDVDVVESMVLERLFNTPMRVAVGTPAMPGTPGTIEYLFRLDRHRLNLIENVKGRVDYRELDLIENVAAGKTLARRLPPGRGVPGLDVFGRPVPAPDGAVPELPTGENILVEGNELKAAIDGHVSFVGGRVSVSPILTVAGDVNYETGNISYDGTVNIAGLIEDAFKVRAAGSLFVGKSIGKSEVEVGGNLVVAGGILGRGEARIATRGDLVALFVENAHVEVAGNLLVNEMILHSNVTVGGDLVMTGARAALVGGVVAVQGSITVKQIGGEGTTRTHLRAGVPIALWRRISGLQKEIETAEDALRRIDDALKAATRSEGEARSAHLEARLGELRGTRPQLDSRIHSLKESLREAEKRLDEAPASAAIHVFEIAMPGTRIEIGGASLLLTAPSKYTTFRRIGTEIKVGPYAGKTVK